jgi:hypothetical protein
MANSEDIPIARRYASLYLPRSRQFCDSKATALRHGFGGGGYPSEPGAARNNPFLHAVSPLLDAKAKSALSRRSIRRTRSSSERTVPETAIALTSILLALPR